MYVLPLLQLTSWPTSKASIRDRKGPVISPSPGITNTPPPHLLRLLQAHVCKRGFRTWHSQKKRLVLLFPLDLDTSQLWQEMTCHDERMRKPVPWPSAPGKEEGCHGRKLPDTSAHQEESACMVHATLTQTLTCFLASLWGHCKGLRRIGTWESKQIWSSPCSESGEQSKDSIRLMPFPRCA